MSFLRQGARDQLWRWREAIVGGGLMALGLWLVAGPGFLLAVPGYAALAGGAAAMRAPSPALVLTASTEGVMNGVTI